MTDLIDSGQLERDLEALPTGQKPWAKLFTPFHKDADEMMEWAVAQPFQHKDTYLPATGRLK